MPSGFGGLSLSIEGPSKADIECHDNEDGSCRVTYKPTEPGNYIINVKFADEHVPGKIHRLMGIKMELLLLKYIHLLHKMRNIGGYYFIWCFLYGKLMKILFSNFVSL